MLVEMERKLANKDSAMRALRSKLSAALRGFEGNGLTMEQRGGKIYVLLDESLLFEVGKSVVSEKGTDALKKLASVLEANPDIDITVEGHTDSTGNAKLNWKLSTERALSISYIILDNSKVAPKRITASGRGQYVPIDTRKTPEALRKNRRSEIILTPKLEELFNLIEKE
ncbi:MAG: OmpA family protein [Bacteroidales bacterium]